MKKSVFQKESKPLFNKNSELNSINDKGSLRQIPSAGSLANSPPDDIHTHSHGELKTLKAECTEETKLSKTPVMKAAQNS